MRIVSSNIRTAEYDAKTRELKMTFVKRPMWEYTYYKVSPRIWVEFIRSESKGRYHADIIEPRYFYSRTVIRGNKR